jgi:hypothetical protein
MEADNIANSSNMNSSMLFGLALWVVPFCVLAIEKTSVP